MMAMAAKMSMNYTKKKFISARTAVRRVFAGKLEHTKGGVTKTGLVKNKGGRIVSRKASLRAKKSPWIAAVKAARSALKIKGFVAVKKGTPLYAKAKELY